ncbi:hypothetical protein D3C81_1882360 [compost metagenome]
MADQQADQRPEHVATEHHGQGPGDNRGDLQVGPQPQGELAVEAAMAFGFGDVVDRAGLDQWIALGTLDDLGHERFFLGGADTVVVIAAST